MKGIVTLILVLFLIVGCSPNAYNIDPNTTSDLGSSEEKPAVTKTEPVKECIEEWSCTNWEPEECPKMESQTRSCTDSNSCGTTKNKSSEKQACTYEEADFCPQFTEVVHGFESYYSEDRDLSRIFFDSYYSYNVITGKEGDIDIDGWKIEGGRYSSLDGYYTYCRKGSKAGENVNYNYCENIGAIKQVVDSSGVIKETLTKDIIIVTNSEGKFVETICK